MWLIELFKEVCSCKGFTHFIFTYEGTFFLLNADSISSSKDISLAKLLIVLKVPSGASFLLKLRKSGIAGISWFLDSSVMPSILFSCTFISRLLFWKSTVTYKFAIVSLNLIALFIKSITRSYSVNGSVSRKIGTVYEN